MLAKDVMTKEVERIEAGATIHEAADKMRTFSVGVLPVFKGEKLIGMITDRDIVVRAIVERKDPDCFPVSDIMSMGVECCREDDPAMAVAR